MREPITRDNYPAEPRPRVAHDERAQDVSHSQKTASCSASISPCVARSRRTDRRTASRTRNRENEAAMVTQREVLTFITKRTAEGRNVTAQDLAGEFWMAAEAAGGHLRRLWRERLVETSSARPPRFRFRLEPGEPLLPLRFRVTARGRQRLRWYERQEEDNDGGVQLFR